MPSDPIWRAVDPAGNIVRAQYTADFGQPYCYVVRLSPDHYLAYSPGRGLQASAGSVIPANAGLTLLAPASGHTLGLKPWKQAFPNATIVASADCAQRLAGKLGLTDTVRPDAADESLPDHVNMHVLPQNRFGEVWLSVRLDDGVYWLVCDALMNLASVQGGFLLKLLFKLYGLRVGLHLHRLFKGGGIDKPAMGAWLIERFSNGKRNVLCPCHGEVYEAEDLSERIVEIARVQLVGSR